MVKQRRRNEHEGIKIDNMITQLTSVLVNGVSRVKKGIEMTLEIRVFDGIMLSCLVNVDYGILKLFKPNYN